MLSFFPACKAWLLIEFSVSQIRKHESNAENNHFVTVLIFLYK